MTDTAKTKKQRTYFFSGVLILLVLVAIFSKLFPSKNTEGANNKEIPISSSTSVPNNVPEKSQKIIAQTYHLGTLSYKIDKYKFKKFVGGLATLKKANGVFLIVTLTITNEGSKQVLIDNSFFKLLDENESEYEYSPEATSSIELSDFPGETFLGMSINPHITKKAKVVFEVPSKNKIYKLVFNDWLSNETLIINLKD